MGNYFTNPTPINRYIYIYSYIFITKLIYT